MTTRKQTLSILAAFAFGGLVVYAVMPTSAPTRRDPQEWALVVVSGHVGVRVYGLFESQEECRRARARLIEAAGAGVKKGPRSLLSDDGSLATFSCLPLSEVRGLSLSPPTP